jgi:hypothetical protein
MSKHTITKMTTVTSFNPQAQSFVPKLAKFNPDAKLFIPKPKTNPSEIFADFQTTYENYSKCYKIVQPGYTFIACYDCMFCNKTFKDDSVHAYNVPMHVGLNTVGGVWLCCGNSKCKQTLVRSVVAMAIQDYHYVGSPYIGTIVEYTHPERPDIDTPWRIRGVRLSKSVHPAKPIFVLISTDYKYNGYMPIPNDFDKTYSKSTEDMSDYYKMIAKAYPLHLRQYFPKFVL